MLPATFTDTVLLDTLTTSHEELTRSKALFLLSIAEFERRDLARERGAPTTVIWLIRQFNLAETTAYEYVSVGTRVSQFQLIAQAFLNAKLSYSVVRLLLRYLDKDNEVELLQLALSMTLRELELALSGRGSEEGDKEHEDSFRMWIDKSTGRVRISGDLNPVLGAELMAALKIGELAFLKDLAEIEPEVFEDDEQLTEEVEAAEEDAERGASGFGAPMSRRMLSAFTGMIQTIRCRPTNKLRAPGAQVNLVVTEDGHTFMPSNPAAPASRLVGATLNGQVRAHLLDAKGINLKLGRSQRLVTDGQVNTLMAKWFYQCAMPGCVHTRFMEFHHIHDYSSGGATNPDNLMPLCSACHSMVTAGTVRVGVDKLDPGKIRFGFPGGESFVSTHRGLPQRDAIGGADALPQLPVGPRISISDDEEEPSFSDPQDSARAESGCVSALGDQSRPPSRA